jgi:hypothetical protein
VTRLTPGQDADTTQLVGLVDQVRVARPGGRGRPRQRPDHLTGDKAYSSPANRAALRARRIPQTAVLRWNEAWQADAVISALDQIARANSSNATATRRPSGSSTASS